MGGAGTRRAAGCWMCPVVASFFGPVQRGLLGLEKRRAHGGETKFRAYVGGALDGRIAAQVIWRVITVIVITGNYLVITPGVTSCSSN